MKLYPILYALSMTLALAQASPSATPSPEAITEPFDWSQLRNLLSQSPGVMNAIGGLPDYHLGLVYDGKGPAAQTLRTLGPSVVSKITSKHYAIVGTIRYTLSGEPGYLEMESWFAPQQPGGAELYYFSRTLADGGPMAKLEGSDDNHEFLLPFDATGAKTSLQRLVLKIHLNGPGQVELRDVRLVQYPDGPAAERSSAPVSNSHAGSNEIVLQVNQPRQSPILGTLNGTSDILPRIGDLLRQRLSANPDLRVVVQGADSLSFNESLHQLIDTLQAAGVRQMRYEAVPASSSTPASSNDHAVFGPPVMERILQLGWNDGDFAHTPTKLEAYAQGAQMSLVYWGEQSADLKLADVGPDFLSTLSSGRYGVTGSYSGVKITPGSYLEMQSFFSRAGGPDEVGYFSRVPIAGDSSATVGDEPTWRMIVVPFQKSGDARLDRVVVNLHLAGGYGTRFAVLRMSLSEFSDNHPFPVSEGTTIPTLSTAFLLPKQAPAPTHLNAPAATKLSSPTPVSLSLRGNGAVVMTMQGTDYTSPQALAAVIRTVVQRDANAAYVIRGTNKVPYAAVKQVLDTFRDTGVRNVFFALEDTGMAVGTPPAQRPIVGQGGWSPFLLGVVTTLLVAAALSGLFLLARRFRQFRHTRELRRIASLDV